MTYNPDPNSPGNRDYHLAVTDFLAMLDEVHATHPEVAAHTLRYIRIEAALGRWAAPEVASAQ